MVRKLVLKIFCFLWLISWVHFSHSVVFNSLWPHGLQHAMPPCPSPTPGAYSNSSPSSRWCHLTISSSIVSFSSCHQSFPASGPFQLSQFFSSGDQSIGVSSSTSVLPVTHSQTYKNSLCIIFYNKVIFYPWKREWQPIPVI